MSDVAGHSVQKAVTEALIACFGTAQEMRGALADHGAAWLAEEMNTETGTRELAAAAVRHAMSLDPAGLTQLGALVMASLRARRGNVILLRAAERIGLAVPPHLRKRPDHVLHVSVLESGAEYEISMSDAGGERKYGKSRPFAEAFDGGIARLNDVLVQASIPRRDTLLNRANLRFDSGVLKALGDDVFDFLVPEGAVRDFYRRKLDMAWSDAVRLQVMLDVRRAPSLAHIPWELAFDPQQRGHICLRPETSLARHVEVVRRYIRPNRGLRFLGFISLPENSDAAVPTEAVQAERERALISGALKNLPGEVDQVWSTAGTRMELGRLLNSRPPGDGWSVFHFIGHGGFDKDEAEGYLLFQSATGAVRVSAEQLANRLLVPGLAPQLVVLNCCSGATAAKGNRFSSFAETLVVSGIRAVIGMQFSVSDPAALCFSENFYGAIVGGSSVQHALNAARQAMSDDYPEWVTPALFTSSEDFALVEPDQLPPAAAEGGRMTGVGR